MHKFVVTTLGLGVIVVGAIGINFLSNEKSVNYEQLSVKKSNPIVTTERTNNTRQNDAQLMILNKDTNINEELSSIENNNQNNFDSSYNQNQDYRSNYDYNQNQSPNYSQDYDYNHDQNQNSRYNHNRNYNYNSNYDYRNGCYSRCSDYYNYAN